MLPPSDALLGVVTLPMSRITRDPELLDIFTGKMSVRHHCSTERVSNLLHISELPLLQKSEQLELKLHEDISFQNSRHIGRLGDWERLTLTSSKLSKS